MTVNNLFKFQLQDSDLEYLFWRFEKRMSLFEGREKYLPEVARSPSVKSLMVKKMIKTKLTMYLATI
jgi:hypothetical protein